ncbi:MAG: aromatic ring-hydroxylating dioxygenase subunit alpha [Thalassobaculales bacterium]
MTDEAAGLLRAGLRNLWYPVCPSYQVQDSPAGITRLSEQIVLWRDAAGKVRAVEDRCPHRGARLSLGWNLGDRLACWYHGVEVDATGTACRVPAQANCRLEGRQLLKTYPAEERNGAIFLWFGEGAPAPLVLPEEMTSDEYDGFLCTAQWGCNWMYAVDNVMDPMHGAYLHAASHSMAYGDKSAEMQVTRTDTGILFEKTGQKGVNFDWVEFGETNCHWMRLAIPYRPSAGPGGPFTICGFVTPVDEETCRVFFWRIRKVSGWQRHTWRFLYKTRLEGLHWAVLEQDREVLENMTPDARSKEFLYQHDAGLGRLRAMLLRQAREQIDAGAVAAQ